MPERHTARKVQKMKWWRLTEKPSGVLNTHRQAKIKNRIKPLMSFRLRSHSLGVCFGQVKTEEKSNEITAIPELLDLLELKGMIVTIDAMGCQKKIVEKIVEKKAEYVISLKGNQQPRRRASGCCSHKVIAVGFNTLCYDTTGIKSSARISNRSTEM